MQNVYETISIYKTSKLKVNILNMQNYFIK